MSKAVAIINIANVAGGGVRVAVHMANILAEEGFEVLLVALTGFSATTLDNIHGSSISRYIGRNLFMRYYLDEASKSLRHLILKLRPLAYMYFNRIITEIINEYKPDTIILFDDIPQVDWGNVKGDIIVYSHFPYAARIMFDIYDALNSEIADYKINLEILKERSLRFFLRKYFYIGDVRKFNNIKVIANSTVTAYFAERTWGSVTSVLHPPVTINSSFNRDVFLKDNIIVSLGAISPNKYHGLAVEAFSKVKRRFKSCKLAIMGFLIDKKYYTYLLKKIRSYELEDSVIILHNLTDRLKWQILYKAKVIVHASKFEPFGIAVAEGMAAGAIPIVYRGYTSGSWIDIVEQGKYGFGFKTVDELADIMDNVLDYSKSELEEWSLKVRERAKLFSLKAFRQKFMKFFNKQ